MSGTLVVWAKRCAMVLEGRVALITGVSRQRGIGMAIARHLGQLGARLFLHGFTPFDRAQPYGVDAEGTEALANQLQQDGMTVAHMEANFIEADAPKDVMKAAVAAYGHIDILIGNHAYGTSEQQLATVTAEEIDYHLLVNVRATLLLIQAFAAQHDEREGGRIVLLISGEERFPMERELAYSASKAAVNNLSKSLSSLLASRSITVNAVNPGPTDSGWASQDLVQSELSMWPGGRWGEPDDAARLIAWLCIDEAKWITGQTINSDGGWRPWRWDPA
ncbi:MAG: SDR family oxidoreductase [Chloroflexi bacterium]|nr:SDR family oxidoreductase [Chloroflexota bacterium]